MFKKFCGLLLGLTMLTACSAAVETPAPASQLRYVLVTRVPDATSTPTPFRPVTLTAQVQATATPQYVDVSPTERILETQPATATIVVTETPAPPNPIETLSLLPDSWTPPAIYAPAGVPTAFPILTDANTVTFLLLGSDLRPGSSFRTDTIVVVALRPESGQISLLSIPRDLWVYIPQWGMQRVNTAYQHGELYNYPGNGPGLLKDTILYNLGIRIDHVAMVDFDGFRRIVDTLGGIDVPIACPYTDWRLIDPSYNPNYEDNWHLFTAGPGLVHMDGDYALWYARSRMKSSDFDRGRRQQEVLRALFDQVLRSNTLSKVPALYDDMAATIKTDLSLSDILQLAWIAPQFTSGDIRSYYLKPPIVSSTITAQGAYVLLPNGPLLYDLVQRSMSDSPKAKARDTIKVEIRNGTLNAGWDALAASRLSYAGFETSFTNADAQTYAQTLLYDVTSEQNTEEVQSLLAVLGLQPSALVSAPREDSPVSYVLIIGYDYQPCFKPDSMAP